MTPSTRPQPRQAAPSEEMAYVGRKPCGCLSFAAVDSEDNRRMCAQESSAAIRRGEAVERVTVEAVRAMRWNCDEHRTEGRP